MQGFGHILQGQLSENIFEPLFFIAFLVGAYFLNIEELTATWAMGFKVLSGFLAFAIGAFFTLSRYPDPSKIGYSRIPDSTVATQYVLPCVFGWHRRYFIPGLMPSCSA